MLVFLAEVQQDRVLPSPFSSQIPNKCPFGNLSRMIFFRIYALFVGDFGLYNDPQT